ncbi:zinc-ribbon domain-containing protein [Methylorubrum sp. SB2]|uniref:zinc-ribbon domain-containing protein n=1 Tax=Methylorubrum subtropicum TaxID=3138812 RepID=UPI00313B2A2B
MLIVCPACASEYRIDAEKVGTAGRSVRCAACRETWFIGPDDVAAGLLAEMTPETDPFSTGLGSEAPEPEPPPAPKTEAPPRRRPPPKATRKPKRSGPRRLSPALAAGLAVAALLPLALLGRATVVRAMPQTAALYAGIGLSVNLRGIDFTDLAAFQSPAEGAEPARLVVEGDLVGVARERVAVPPVEIEVRDEHGQSLYRWSVPGPRAALEPGERARFKASLSAPPAQGRRIEVRFGETVPSPAPQEH